MTDLNKAEQIQEVLEIIADQTDDQGKTSIKKVRAFIDINDDITLSGKEVTKILKDEGVSGDRIGFVDTFYTWLETERDHDEVIDYINGDGEFGTTSPNIIRFEKHYVKIADLVRRVQQA